MSTKYTIEQCSQAAQQVGEFALSMGTHDLALMALLSAYATIADANPCCTLMASKMTKSLSEVLSNVVASRETTKH